MTLKTMSDNTQPDTLYHLQPDEPLPAGIKRIALEQAEYAIWRLSTAKKNQDKAVHEARKCCKRTRAVLRLVRDEIGQDIYRRENVLYRDAARKLSDLRSSAVMAETLDALRKHFADDLSPNDFAGVKKALMRKHYQTLREAVKSGNLLVDVAEELCNDQDRLLHLPLETEDFSTLRQGLRRVYRRGRRSMYASKADPTVEHLHEWRKRVKYLHYQMSILNLLEPVKMQALADDLKTLSDLTGLDHDLAELSIVVQTTPQIIKSDEELQTLLTLINLYRLELQASRI